ncbi:hypothetical protein ACIBTW_07040 [Micromonospora parva]
MLDIDLADTMKALEAYTNSVTGWMSHHIVCGRTSRPKLSKIRAGGGF